ncbi:MAG: class I SAM-dependent rRNA methyltransferase [Phycisphaerae bacterium]|nr:class I SAM-dependent rRNA methyltransferase [Phycisphaerae bacterium]MCZ2400700.1 class I SAM-dependent rRNA methyltransferase [Phycisphaerae bacterium]
MPKRPAGPPARPAPRRRDNAPRPAAPAPGTPAALPVDRLVAPWVRLRSATSHPFVYQRMIAEVDPSAAAGDVVNVYDKAGRHFGSALYNGRSQIALRMLAAGDVSIDDAFWRGRLEQAVALRRRLRLDDVTDAYRLLHAEGDGLSGVIVERYADCLVFELFSIGMFLRRAMLAEMLCERLGPPAALDRPRAASPHWRVVFRADQRIQALEGFDLPPPRDDAPQRLVVREHGVRYRVDAAGGQKTGFFCDQRENRRRFAELCADGDVLDAFCYGGGFGLCAKRLGRARSVTSVDLDEDALALAVENANLNQARIQHVHADVFGYLRQMIANRRQFDAVVLDPPKLVTRREELEPGLRKYGDLNALGVQVVRPGGWLLTCSCSGLVSPTSFVETVHRAARRAGRTLQMIGLTGAGPDHPVLLDCPESAYLKAVWLRVW